jgi:integral membrane sensor domain MASE1
MATEQRIELENPSGLRMVAINLVLAALYLGFGKLGLLLALPPGYGTAIWPPSGIAFAACLIWVGLPSRLSP